MVEALDLPLIRRWIERVPSLGHQVDDRSQEVLLVLVRETSRLDRRREGPCRAWLRLVTFNEVHPGSEKP
jgi:hypothetical protein